MSCVHLDKALGSVCVFRLTRILVDLELAFSWRNAPICGAVQDPSCSQQSLKITSRFVFLFTHGSTPGPTPCRADAFVTAACPSFRRPSSASLLIPC
jgi:hypothetical protein